MEAELSVGVRAGVENLVVHRGVRDGDKNRAAGWGVSRTRANDKGLWGDVDDSTRTERNVLVTSNGPRVTGGGPRETGVFRDESGGKPWEGSSALLCVLFYLRKKAQ